MRRILFLLAFCFLRPVWATDLVYLSAQKRADLQALFMAAHTPKAIDGSWSCDMFGVRSGLQERDGVPLYRFTNGANQLQNHGSQIVQVYGWQNHRLQGTNSRITDELRLAEDGHLISQMTLTSSGAVLAYSLCRRSSGS